MKKVYVVSTAGPCLERQLDVKKIEAFLVNNGYRLSDAPLGSDYIILVTCAFNEVSEKLSLAVVAELNKYSSELIVVGCLPAINEKSLKECFAGVIIPTKNLEELDLFLKHDIDFVKIPDANSFRENIGGNVPLKYVLKTFCKQFEFSKEFLFKVLFNIKNLLKNKSGSYVVRIARGCSADCTYCIIKKAIGKLRSKPLHKCIEEVRRGIDEGYCNFTFLADDIGAYGIDLEEDISYVVLLQRVIEQKGCHNICLGAISPRWLVDYWREFKQVLASGKIKFITTSIQSGSNKVLECMRRNYDINKVVGILEELKREYAFIKITTQIIIGFPGETRADFLCTLELLKEYKFDFVQLFSYSDRKGTPAYGFESKVSVGEKKERMQEAVDVLKNIGYYHYKLFSTEDVDTQINLCL